MPKSKRGHHKGPRVIADILRMKAMGLSKRKIALALGCSRNTVDKYLDVKQESHVEGARRKVTLNDQFNEMLGRHLAKVGDAGKVVVVFRPSDPVVSH